MMVVMMMVMVTMAVIVAVVGVTNNDLRPSTSTS
jgi:hypothetical protein